MIQREEVIPHSMYQQYQTLLCARCVSYFPEPHRKDGAEAYLGHESSSPSIEALDTPPLLPDHSESSVHSLRSETSSLRAVSRVMVQGVRAEMEETVGGNAHEPRRVEGEVRMAPFACNAFVYQEVVDHPTLVGSANQGTRPRPTLRGGSVFCMRRRCRGSRSCGQL